MSTVCDFGIGAYSSPGMWDWVSITPLILSMCCRLRARSMFDFELLFLASGSLEIGVSFLNAWI